MRTAIQNSTSDDLDEIFRLYCIATDFQKAKAAVNWPEFDRQMIGNEILENRQWKIEIDGKTACVLATTFSDPQIWEERNEDPALYIHRIATDPDFRGQNLVTEIVRWAKGYATRNNKIFIRMDTVGENKGLISYYERCGFEFLGLSTLKNTEGLPAYYSNATVCLFEIKLNSTKS
ncbi:GNAT family N-acetyltransferase [uncultured Chryseobacterium sp.]|uniref:GNAT family N-acetyltransferase n=1 Tax=uncultured Chryseobacterium sp. TaxID=259322 RepID=UPI0025EA7D77|nr:GNAT family N-acetyltransferase [uncultured Chryseobacterium sp.]